MAISVGQLLIHGLLVNGLLLLLHKVWLLVEAIGQGLLLLLLDAVLVHIQCVDGYLYYIVSNNIILRKLLIKS